MPKPSGNRVNTPANNSAGLTRASPARVVRRDSAVDGVPRRGTARRPEEPLACVIVLIGSRAQLFTLVSVDWMSDCPCWTAVLRFPLYTASSNILNQGEPGSLNTAS